jgi:hypothetical protein
MQEPIEVLVDRIGRDLQTLENRLRDEGDRRVKIRFPRGFLRTAESFREQYWFIRSGTLQRNVAYTLILSDVYRWLLNRTDLWGTAREMIIKEGLCLIGNLCESITKDAAKGICNKRASFKERTAGLVSHGIISKDLKNALDKLWDWRNREHLFLLNEWEYGKYTLEQYNEGIRTLHALRTSLDTYFKRLKTRL